MNHDNSNCTSNTPDMYYLLSLFQGRHLMNNQTPIVIEDVKCLERHKYAPELNTLHMVDESVRILTPQCTTIEGAIEYANTHVIGAPLFKMIWLDS